MSAIAATSSARDGTPRSRRQPPHERLLCWLLGSPGPQRLRVTQSLLAVMVYAVFAGVQRFEAAHGLVDRTQADRLAGFYLLGSLAFFLVIRTGSNRRFTSDPSLTFAQCIFGIVATSIAYAITGPARGAVMSIMLLVLVFAMFALPPQRIRLLAALAFGLLAWVMAWRSQHLPQQYPPAVEATHFMFASIVVSAIAVLSVRMGAMRERLCRQKAELEHALEQNRRLARLDELTGLVNRRHMMQVLHDEHERQRGAGMPMSVALIDVDLFKRINDRYGHAAGDSVLKEFARVAGGGLRACDVLSRWGGEEFLLLMPDMTLESSTVMVERLRAALAAKRWPRIDPDLAVTFSAGVATWRAGESLDSLIERADQAMYRAKTGGRDRVATAPQPLVAKP